MFKKIDMYASPITLKYKNMRKFYTNFGALASLCVYIIMLSQLSTKLLEMGQENGIKDSQFTALSKNAEEQVEGEEDPLFFIAVRLVKSDGTTINDPR